MTQWTALFILCLTHGIARADNICQTEQGTISDACSDEGNMFLQRTGSEVSPKRAKKQAYHKLQEEAEQKMKQVWHKLREGVEGQHKDALLQEDGQPSDQQHDQPNLVSEAMEHALHKIQEEEEEEHEDPEQETRDQPNVLEEATRYLKHDQPDEVKPAVLQDMQPGAQHFSSQSLFDEAMRHAMYKQKLQQEGNHYDPEHKARDEFNILKEAANYMRAKEFFEQAVLQDKQKSEEDKLRSTKVTEIEGIDCETMNKPLQVMRGPDGFNVKELDIGTGTYSSKFLIPWDVATGGYSDLNACSIHPADSVLYCVVFAGAPYLVRIDATPRMEFVGRLPWGTYISGAFAPMTGRLYISTLNAGFLVLDNVISLRAFQDKADAADLRSLVRTKPTSWVFTADCVVIEKDLEGNGVEEYLFSLYGPRLQIAKYDNATQAFSNSWWLKVQPRRWDNIYGAGWGFQNKLFFSSNRGSGVFQVPLEGFSLKPEDGFLDDDYMMQLTNLGPSEQTGMNDGMNCLNAASPWIVPFDCAANPGPLQAFWRDAHYDLQKLNTTTGNYTNVFKVTKNTTSPPFRVLNAWAINPADTIVYASMVIAEWNDDIYPTPPPFYIVRVDDTKVRFVAKVQALAGSPIAGAFDDYGTYYVVSNPSLLKFPGIDAYTAYESYQDPDLPFFSEATNDSYIAIRNMTGAAQIADVVAVDVDLSDGSGVATWVIAANTALQLVLMKPATGEYWVTQINDVLEGTELEGVWERQNMGAAWSFEGKVFFSTNDGAGVFQLPMDEITFPLEGTVQLTRVGPSAPIHDNDGLNCIDRRSPWSS